MTKAAKSNKQTPSHEGVVVSGAIAELFGGDQWLITEQGCRQLQAAAQVFVQGMAKAEAPEPYAGTVKAVVPVVGPLARYQNWISDYMGWSTTEGIQTAVQALDADASVTEIVLMFDTPGGVAFGLPECSDVIAGCETRIVAYTSGMCASAGYWLASQCDAIYTGRLGMLGSIGVRSYYYKGDGGDVVSKNAPKKLGSREQTQALVDEVETLFIETVAAGRGVTAQHVIDNYGAGDVMLGKAAVEAGLADDMTSLDDILAGTIGMPPVQSTISSSETGEPMTTDKKTGGIPTAEHEQAIADALENGKKEGAKASTDAAVTAERERVSAIIEAGQGKPPGQVKTLIAKGIDAETAKELLAAAPDATTGGTLNTQMDGSNPDITNDKPPTDGEDTSASVWDSHKGDDK